MALHVYRYKLAGPSLAQLSSQVPGSPSVSSLAPAQYIDVTVDNLYWEDLTHYMALQGFSYDSMDPAVTTATQANGSAGAASPWTGVSRTVRAASTADITLSGLQVVDGVVLFAGDRVLAKNQGTALQNGIWVVSAGAWYQPNDWATGIVVPEMGIRVSEGTVNAHSWWTLTTQGAIVVGTTATTWAKVSATATTPSTVAVATAAVGTATDFARADHVHAVTYGSAANTVTQGNDARLTNSRAPTGTASGDLAGTYPSPTLATAVRLSAGGFRFARLASTVDVPSISGLLTIDGVVTVAGNRVLLKNQTTGSQNGIWTVAAGAWTRPADWATGLVNGEMEIGVSEGVSQAHTDWSVQTQGTITVGTTSVAITQVAATATGTAGGVLSGTYPNPGFATAYSAATFLPAQLGSAAGVIGSSTRYSPADHAHPVLFGNVADSVAQGNDARFSDSRSPSGSAGGVLGGNYPNPTFDSAYGPSALTPVALGVATGVVGTSTAYSREDHVHALTYGTGAGTVTEGNDSRLSDSRAPTGAAGGILSGTYPNPAFATGFGVATATPSAVASATGSAGTSTRYAAGDHVHGVSYGTAAGTVAQGNDSRLSDSRTPTGSAGGVLSGTYPSPSFATGYGPSSLTPVALGIATGAVGVGTNYAREDHVHALTFGSAANTVTQGNDSRLSDSRTPTGAAGGVLGGTYPSPSFNAAYAASSVLPAVLGSAGGNIGTSTNYARADHLHALTYGTAANTAAQGNDSRLSDARVPTGAAGGVLGGTYPSPSFGAAYGPAATTPVAIASPTGAVGTATTYARGDHAHAVTYGSAANTVTEGDDPRLSDARIPTGPAGGALSGTYPNPVITIPGAPNQVLYSTGGGVSPAVNLNIDVEGYPIIGEETSATPAVPASGLTLFARSRAGSRILSTISPNGLVDELQTALWTKNVRLWNALGGSATTVFTLNFGNTISGTVTAEAITFGGGLANTLNRVSFVSSNTAGNSCGTRHGTLQFFLGNVARQGGFFYSTRFYIDTVKASMRWFVGMYGSAAAIGNVNPSTLTNIIGFAVDAGQSTVRFMCNDGSGTATAIDLGANFPAITANVVYEARFFVAPNSSTVYYSLERLDSAAFTEGSVNTNVPVATLLSPQIWMNNSTPNGVVNIGVISQYLETEY